MPKSKLRSSISIGEIDSIQATREKVSVESITVNDRLVKRPRFLRAQISPRFRAIGSIETDEVEYDTYVKWVVSKAVLHDIDIDIPSEVTSTQTIWTGPKSLADPYGIAFTWTFCCAGMACPKIRFYFNSGKFIGARLYYTPDVWTYVLNGTFYIIDNDTYYTWIATGRKPSSRNDIIRVSAFYRFRPSSTSVDVIGRAQKNGNDYPTQMSWETLYFGSKNYNFGTLNKVDIVPDGGKMSKIRVIAPVAYEFWAADPWLGTG